MDKSKIQNPKSKMEISAFVDRIEGDFAVILLGDDQETKVDFPLKYLPSEVSEGQFLRISIEIDHEKADEVRKKVRKLLDELTKKSAENPEKWKL